MVLYAPKYDRSLSLFRGSSHTFLGSAVVSLQLPLPLPLPSFSKKKEAEMLQYFQMEKYKHFLRRTEKPSLNCGGYL